MGPIPLWTAMLGEQNKKIWTAGTAWTQWFRCCMILTRTLLCEQLGAFSQHEDDDQEVMLVAVAVSVRLLATKLVWRHFTKLGVTADAGPPDRIKSMWYYIICTVDTVPSRGTNEATRTKRPHEVLMRTSYWGPQWGPHEDLMRSFRAGSIKVM